MEVRPGYKLTEVGVIPEDWEVASIGAIASFKSGDGINVTALHEQSSDTPIPVYGGNGIAGYAARALVQQRVVVVGRVGQKCGEVYITEGPAWITDNALYPRAFFRKVNVRFLGLALKGAGLNGVKNRNDLPLLTQSILHSVHISLPPTKAEQDAIAEALSDAAALIESLEQLLNKKHHLKQGAMQELLTGKKRLPGFESKPGYKQTEMGVIAEDWGLVSALEACSKIQDGTHFSPRIRGNDYRYVTSRNVRFGYLDLSTAGWIDAAQHQAIYRRCDVKKGDLLLTKDGANTGNAALNTLAEKFSLLSSVAFLRFNPSKYCAAFFLQQVLTSQGQRQIQDAMAGNAITRLTLEKINKLRFPVPLTTAEQEAIATVLSDMDADIAALEAKLAKARHLKQGMMQELLTGRIRLPVDGGRPTK